MAFDAHIHCKNKETGGFIIGLEGKPYFEGTLNNAEVLELHNPNKDYISFYYIAKDECSNVIQHPYLKYHPRREQYSVQDVIKSIRINQPKAVIIDTLNEPFWVPYDYWKVVREFHEIPFILAHSGGYLINDFIKICHFQSNVWIDFALTHTNLGRFGDVNTGLQYINDAIRYALHSPFSNRVLLGSDFPFFSQEDVFDFYSDYIELLDQNFKKLLEVIK